MKEILYIFLILYIISFAKQEEIKKISNLGEIYLSFGRTYKIVEFNCTPYFENDSRNIYLLFKNKWNVWGDLFVFYDISKLKIWYRDNRPYIGEGYDFSKSLMNQEKFSFTAKENIGYFVFADFNFDIDSLTLQYFHMNSYYNISKYNSYDFSFPYTGFHFTFSYKANNEKMSKIFYFEYSANHTVKTYLYNSNKTLLKTIDKIYGGFQFDRYNTDELFIKIEVSKGGSFKINLRLENEPELFHISQDNSTIDFDKTLSSAYYFYLEPKKVPENIIEFYTNPSGVRESYLPYYYTNLTDIEEINNELIYRFVKTRKVIDGSTTIYSHKHFTLPIKFYSKKLFFMIFTNINKTDFFVKSVFYSYKEIYTNQNYNFNLGKNKPYYIYKYTQTNFFNNSLDGFIYISVDNADKDSSLYVYDDLSKVNIDHIRNYSDTKNLKEKNWKSFKYSSGDLYILITNFNLIYDKTYSLLIKNSNEYYDISNEINKDTNYTLSMKFNETFEQYLTFSIKSQNNCYIYFDITPAYLRANISTLTFNNKTIIPVDDKYYKLNIYEITNFKIYLSSNVTFSEYNVFVQRIYELPINFNNILIVLIVLGVIHIALFIGYLVVLKRRKNLDRFNLNISNLIN